jgi:hypothetical protein
MIECDDRPDKVVSYRFSYKIDSAAACTAWGRRRRSGTATISFLLRTRALFKPYSIRFAIWRLNLFFCRPSAKNAVATLRSG